MRILTLTATGDYQAYLVNRIAMHHELCGCIFHTSRPKPRIQRWWKYRNPYQLVDHLSARHAANAQQRDVEALHRKLFYVGGRRPEIPLDTHRLIVSDINDATCCQLIRQLRPEAIVVNGTNLLRNPVFEAAADCRFGIINIHTGLSPYSRGGNCNLHCILHHQPQYVGVTVHYIDAGIDSGDIILTARPPLELVDTIESIEEKNFRLGIDLLLLALEDIKTQTANRIKQWTKGKLFLRRTGYDYRPRLRVMANDILQEQGLLRQYLAHRRVYDERVRLVTSQRSEALCRGLV